MSIFQYLKEFSFHFSSYLFINHSNGLIQVKNIKWYKSLFYYIGLSCKRRPMWHLILFCSILSVFAIFRKISILMTGFIHHYITWNRKEIRNALERGLKNNFHSMLICVPFCYSHFNGIKHFMESPIYLSANLNLSINNIHFGIFYS